PRSISHFSVDGQAPLVRTARAIVVSLVPRDVGDSTQRDRDTALVACLLAKGERPFVDRLRLLESPRQPGQVCEPSERPRPHSLRRVLCPFEELPQPRP